jgi:hypothetical protein
MLATVAWHHSSHLHVDQIPQKKFLFSVWQMVLNCALKHYLDFYKFIIPLRDRLEQCSREINIFDYEVIPNLYEQYPHEIIQQVFDKAKVLPKTIENFKIMKAQ